MANSWNYDAEAAVAGILGTVPVVGSLLSGLTNILWPTGQNVWGEIESQVEALMQEEINQLVYQLVTNDLVGLQNNINDYLLAVNTGDVENISTQWIATKSIFDYSLPNFQSPGSQVLLLPLFGQFGSLYFSLLRDGVMYGSSWGWNASYLASVQTALTSSISSFTTYANQYYQQGYQQIVDSTPTNYNADQPFMSVNGYVRQMTLTLLDFVNMWPYYNPAVYSYPVTVYLTREIYSDPVGTCANSGNIVLPSAPTQPISQLTVWGWDRIDAVQLAYPTNGGPGGVTVTARMGDSNGGSNQPPHGGVFNISSTNPITIAGGLSGSILNAFTFTFADGSTTGELGGNYPGGNAYAFSYPNEIMSSIHINGISDYYGSADCAVFGFQYQNGQVISASALLNMYVTYPKPINISDFKRIVSAQQIGQVDLEELHKAERWQQQREEFWASLKKKQTTGKKV